MQCGLVLSPSYTGMRICVVLHWTENSGTNPLLALKGSTPSFFSQFLSDTYSEHSFATAAHHHKSSLTLQSSTSHHNLPQHWMPSLFSLVLKPRQLGMGRRRLLVAGGVSWWRAKALILGVESGVLGPPAYSELSTLSSLSSQYVRSLWQHYRIWE